ncbi:MAG: LemA family protein [Bacteroidetes bacterium]|nr:LemA family protein [Bacteroidota bacterium]
MKLSKGWIIGIVAIAVVFLLIVSMISMYNKMPNLEEGVNSQWAKVESAYQRRSDLIPNLVNTVKGVANFEQQTLIGVVEARAKATSVSIDPTKMTAANMQQFQKAQDGLGSALSKLMVVVEKYPELKATQNFLELQSQLEGTENRINVERNKFNEEAQKYNSFIRRFPNNMFAGMFGFQKKAYFEATAGAEKAPEVKF